MGVFRNVFNYFSRSLVSKPSTNKEYHRKYKLTVRLPVATYQEFREYCKSEGYAISHATEFLMRLALTERTLVKGQKGLGIGRTT